MNTALHVIGYCFLGAFVLCAIVAVIAICWPVPPDGGD